MKERSGKTGGAVVTSAVPIIYLGNLEMWAEARSLRSLVTALKQISLSGSKRWLAMSITLAVMVLGCHSYYEIPIEVPIDAKLDLSAYNRVLVASFTTQTSVDMDLDSETIRLLRNQLRMRSNLQVIDANVEPLGNFSEENLQNAGLLDEFKELEQDAKADGEDILPQEWIELEQDKLLDDEEYWMKIGEEYQEPLIVTGKLRFESESRAGFTRRDRYLIEPSLCAAPGFRSG